MSMTFDPFHRTIVDDEPAHPAGADATRAPVLAQARGHRRRARAFLLFGSSALALTVALGTRALLEGE